MMHHHHQRRRRPPALSTIFACLVLNLGAAWAQVRVDDSDPLIVYSPAGSWSRNEVQDPLDDGGFHMLTDDPGATATFSFVGTGIEYSAPLWSDDIHTAISVDGAAPITISLTDTSVPTVDGGGATVASAVRWSALDLIAGPHVVVVSVPAGLTFGVVDSFTYYTDGTALPSTTSSTSRTVTDLTDTASEPASSSNNNNNSSAISSTPPKTRTGLTIALATVSSVGALLLLILLIFWLRRRNMRNAEHRAWLKSQAEGGAGGPLMDEVDDGLRAGAGRRFKSVPSARNLVRESYLSAGGAGAGGPGSMGLMRESYLSVGNAAAGGAGGRESYLGGGPNANAGVSGFGMLGSASASASAAGGSGSDISAYGDTVHSANTTHATNGAGANFHASSSSAAAIQAYRQGSLGAGGAGGNGVHDPGAGSKLRNVVTSHHHEAMGPPVGGAGSAGGAGGSSVRYVQQGQGHERKTSSAGGSGMTGGSVGSPTRAKFTVGGAEGGRPRSRGQ